MNIHCILQDLGLCIRILQFCHKEQDMKCIGNTTEEWNNIFVGEKLILTYETEQSVIQTKDIERLARNILLLVDNSTKSL